MTVSDMLIDDILSQADQLPVEEQLALAAKVLERARAKVRQTSAPRWRSVRGRYGYPAVGDDAQRWINQLRDEWNDRTL